MITTHSISVHRRPSHRRHQPQRQTHDRDRRVLGYRRRDGPRSRVCHADVTLAVRRLEAGGNVVADITASTDNDGVHVAALDLTDLSSHDKFVAEWEGRRTS